MAADNIHGWGTTSSLSSVQTTDTDVPDAPTNVMTAVSSSGLGIDITWDPITDNGATVTEVQVYIETANGTYSIDTSECDGTTDSTIVSNRMCTVLMTTLRGSPWLLVYGEEVVAHVLAYNSVGWSTASNDSTGGATIQTEPTQMSAPTITGHTSRTVSVSWTALTTEAQIGGSSITSYALWYAESPYTTWT